MANYFGKNKIIDKSRPVRYKKSNIPSSMGHVESRVNQRGPPRKAKYSWVTDSAKYREGMVIRTPVGE